MASKDLQRVDDQVELPLSREPNRAQVPLALIHTQKTFGAALALAVQVSGLEAKEIYIPLNIDAGHWSRIRNSEAHFPNDRMIEGILIGVFVLVVMAVKALIDTAFDCEEYHEDRHSEGGTEL